MKTVLIRNLATVLMVGGLLAPASCLHADVVVHGKSVNLYQAQGVVGTHVLSTDGRDVGRITQFIFDFGAQPRLTDVVMTQGLFGPSWVVPVDALHQKGDVCHLDLSSRAFDTIAPMHGKVSRYLTNRHAVAKLDHEYHVAVQKPDRHFVTYSRIRQREIIGAHGADVGFLNDVLINLNQGEAFYLQVVPTNMLYRGQSNTLRLEIPASSVAHCSPSEIDLKIPFDPQLVNSSYVTQKKGMSSTRTPFGRVYHLNVG